MTKPRGIASNKPLTVPLWRLVTNCYQTKILITLTSQYVQYGVSSSRNTGVHRGFWITAGAALLALLLALFGLAPSFASSGSVHSTDDNHAGHGVSNRVAANHDAFGNAVAGRAVSERSAKKAHKTKKSKKGKAAKKHKGNAKAQAKAVKKKKKIKAGKPAVPVATTPGTVPATTAPPAESVAPAPTQPVQDPAQSDPIDAPTSMPSSPSDTPTDGAPADGAPGTDPLPPGETTAPADTSTPGVQDVVQDRAMWLWNWDSNQAVLDFSIAHNVKEIFTYALPGFMQDDALRTKLSDLTSRGTALGIRMWAMGGDPSWVTSPQTAVNWVNEVNASGFFNGIHLEIEPHSEAGYWDDQDARNQLYISLLDQVEAAKGDQTLELSLPWWYHTISYDNSTLDLAAINAVDQITIVTFDDSVAGVESDAQQAAAIADAQNKPYRLASETNSVTDADWITFVGQTNSEMLSVQNQVSQQLRSNPNYLGFAVEDYTGWSALAP